MRLVITIRTADRSPRKNYVAHTVRALSSEGHRVHVFPTDPDVAWLLRELGDLPVTIHVPDHRCTPNENGLRQITALDTEDAEWIGLFEDDIECIRNPVSSITRWLEAYQQHDFHVYRAFALPRTPLTRCGRHAAYAPLKEMRGSQAVFLRAADARLLATWAASHPLDWRPKEAPFQDRPERGFDKLIGYWALQQWPAQRNGLVSVPMLVNHSGRFSLLHTHGVSNDSQFAGRDFKYPEAAL